MNSAAARQNVSSLFASVAFNTVLVILRRDNSIRRDKNATAKLGLNHLQIKGGDLVVLNVDLIRHDRNATAKLGLSEWF